MNCGETMVNIWHWIITEYHFLIGFRSRMTRLFCFSSSKQFPLNLGEISSARTNVDSTDESLNIKSPFMRQYTWTTTLQVTAEPFIYGEVYVRSTQSFSSFSPSSVQLNVLFSFFTKWQAKKKKNPRILKYFLTLLQLIQFCGMVVA